MKSVFMKLGFAALILFSALNVAAQKEGKDPEKKFNQIDTNNDSLISLDEYKNKTSKKEISEDKLTSRFAKLDVDSDGSLTLEEFKVRKKKKKKSKE